jgi:hypothetical protein
MIMDNLNFKRKNSISTKTEIRKLIEVETKKFVKNGGVIKVLDAHIGPKTPSCDSKEWEQPTILGIPSEIDNIYKQVTDNPTNFLNEKYINKIKDY